MYMHLFLKYHTNSYAELGPYMYCLNFSSQNLFVICNSNLGKHIDETKCDAPNQEYRFESGINISETAVNP